MKSTVDIEILKLRKKIKGGAALILVLVVALISVTLVLVLKPDVAEDQDALAIKA
jgi:predicted nucleic acid-binding Zn ribbon protein